MFFNNNEMVFLYWVDVEIGREGADFPDTLYSVQNGLFLAKLKFLEIHAIHRMHPKASANELVKPLVTGPMK
jgi:hypothetical protein